MHLLLEKDKRHGQAMMKYASNHHKFFKYPFMAYLCGFFQTVACLLTEYFSIIFLGSVANPVEVIVKFLVVANVAKIDNMFYWITPKENKAK
jgi:hypothetical protein